MDSALILMHWNGSEDDKELIPGLSTHLSFLARQTDPAKVNREKMNYGQYLAQIYKPSAK